MTSQQKPSCHPPTSSTSSVSSVIFSDSEEESLDCLVASLLQMCEDVVPDLKSDQKEIVEIGPIDQEEYSNDEFLSLEFRIPTRASSPLTDHARDSGCSVLNCVLDKKSPEKAPRASDSASRDSNKRWTCVCDQVLSPGKRQSVLLGPTRNADKSWQQNRADKGSVKGEWQNNIQELGTSEVSNRNQGNEEPANYLGSSNYSQGSSETVTVNSISHDVDMKKHLYIADLYKETIHVPDIEPSKTLCSNQLKEQNYFNILQSIHHYNEIDKPQSRQQSGENKTDISEVVPSIQNTPFYTETSLDVQRHTVIRDTRITQGVPETLSLHHNSETCFSRGEEGMEKTQNETVSSDVDNCEQFSANCVTRDSPWRKTEESQKVHDGIEGDKEFPTNNSVRVTVVDSGVDSNTSCEIVFSQAGALHLGIAAADYGGFSVTEETNTEQVSQLEGLVPGTSGNTVGHTLPLHNDNDKSVIDSSERLNIGRQLEALVDNQHKLNVGSNTITSLSMLHPKIVKQVQLHCPSETKVNLVQHECRDLRERAEIHGLTLGSQQPEAQDEICDRVGQITEGCIFREMPGRGESQVIQQRISGDNSPVREIQANEELVSSERVQVENVAGGSSSLGNTEDNCCDTGTVVEDTTLQKSSCNGNLTRIDYITGTCSFFNQKGCLEKVHEEMEKVIENEKGLEAVTSNLNMGNTEEKEMVPLNISNLQAREIFKSENTYCGTESESHLFGSDSSWLSTKSPDGTVVKSSLTVTQKKGESFSCAQNGRFLYFASLVSSEINDKDGTHNEESESCSSKAPNHFLGNIAEVSIDKEELEPEKVSPGKLTARREINLANNKDNKRIISWNCKKVHTELSPTVTGESQDKIIEGIPTEDPVTEVGHMSSEVLITSDLCSQDRMNTGASSEINIDTESDDNEFATVVDPSHPPATPVINQNQMGKCPSNCKATLVIDSKDDANRDNTDTEKIQLFVTQSSDIQFTAVTEFGGNTTANGNSSSNVSCRKYTEEVPMMVTNENKQLGVSLGIPDCEVPACYKSDDFEHKIRVNNESYVIVDSVETDSEENSLSILDEAVCKSRIEASQMSAKDDIAVCNGIDITSVKKCDTVETLPKKPIMERQRVLSVQMKEAPLQSYSETHSMQFENQQIKEEKLMIAPNVLLNSAAENYPSTSRTEGTRFSCCQDLEKMETSSSLLHLAVERSQFSNKVVGQTVPKETFPASVTDKHPQHCKSVEGDLKPNTIKQETVVKEMKERTDTEYFISDDPVENKDNEDPEWEFLRKLSTDEERYKMVRKRWKNLVIPDPNNNLTYHGFKRKQIRLRKATVVNNGHSDVKSEQQRGVKRHRSATYDKELFKRDEDSKPKRQRTSSCIAILQQNIQKEEEKCEAVRKSSLQEMENFISKRCEELKNIWHQKMREMMSSGRQLTITQSLKLDWLREQQKRVIEHEKYDKNQQHEHYMKKYVENVKKLECAADEVMTFRRFYSGLEIGEKQDATQLDDHQQQEISDICKMYDMFSMYYGSS